MSLSMLQIGLAKAYLPLTSNYCLTILASGKAQSEGLPIVKYCVGE